MKTKISRKIIVALLFITGLLRAQTQFNVKGHIKWCEETDVPSDLMVNMLVNDVVEQTTFTDVKGNFVFHDFVETRAFTLQVSYYGLLLKPLRSASDITSQGEDLNISYSFCCPNIAKAVKDSARADWDKKLQTVYYYGLPTYPDYKIKWFSAKYGVRYQNLGCAGGDENSLNREVKSMLNKKLGSNWEKVLWAEIRKALDR